MTGLYDDNDHFVVPDLINNTIVPLSHPVPLQSRKLLNTFGPRIFRQRVNSGENPPKVPIGDSAHIPGNGFAEDDPISSQYRFRHCMRAIGIWNLEVLEVFVVRYCCATASHRPWMFSPRRLLFPKNACGTDSHG